MGTNSQPLADSMYIAIAFSLFVSTPLVSDMGTFVPQERDVIKKEYPVSPGGTIHLDMDRGNIKVEVVDENRVFIELERVVKEDEKAEARDILKLHEYAFDKRGNDVFISTKFDSESKTWRFRRRPRLRVSLVVRIPAEFNVTFENGAGSVDVSDVHGYVRGTTGAGNITIDEIKGEVNVTLGAGNIDISGELVTAEARTGAGNIAIYGLRGPVRAATGAGNIDAVIVHQPDGNSKFSTGAGNVVVALAAGVGVYVQAKTKVGSAKCEFPLEVSKNFLSKSFSGEINGGGAEIELVAGMGNVVLKRH